MQRDFLGEESLIRLLQLIKTELSKYIQKPEIKDYIYECLGDIDVGSLNLKIVTELPTEDIDEHTIYLVLAANGEDGNAFDEYIYVNGKWEKIGNAAVQVDLTDYVKFDDYATSSKAGVVRILQGADSGLQMTSTGILYVTQATETQIADKTNNKQSITPNNLDYAVKVGLTTNTETLTEDEKATARAWLGAMKKPKASAGGYNTIPMVLHDGSDSSMIAYNKPYHNAIAVYGAGGILSTNTPTADIHCANKKYVDDAIGDIETTVDSIIALQEEFLIPSGDEVSY